MVMPLDCLMLWEGYTPGLWLSCQQDGTNKEWYIERRRRTEPGFRGIRDTGAEKGWNFGFCFQKVSILCLESAYSLLSFALLWYKVHWLWNRAGWSGIVCAWRNECPGEFVSVSCADQTPSIKWRLFRNKTQNIIPFQPLSQLFF